ncbi:carboxylate-amine ligase [Methylobacterium persicinum]|uniref:Putative glutamate--cysteine ligase 2 n=1 Tax=Methylobacterium persicinum TaxID=374426 RepID=A0ABU0HLU0_9HYPH|nr:carboxylate-amine ligase [Methylobacterium persicinum]MDQ0443298.1 carboxylate-amine ligase [Methylobacterium persicinum]GJE37711.1 Putative glutamate--cysteine ligase 2 [Methylobacterium persicinum]
MSGHPYSFGIEEEYFLADARTRGTPQGDLAAFHAEAKAGLPETGRELVAAQIELCTPPLAVMDEARRNLGGQRARLAMIAGRHGLTLLSCGTHPVARRESQTASDGERYQGILSDLGIAARRALICGMHVHIEVPDPDGRIDLMNRLLPFQPMLLALSASSPFWQGEATGLMAYRLSVFGELPRTGLPEIFADAAAHDRFVAIMTRAGAIADASYLWWSLRPSIKYPTLELRIADACTRLEDSLCLAALFRCLVRLCVRRPDLNAGLDGVSRALTLENLWRAQRDGVRAALIDEARGGAVPFNEALDAVLALIAEDADALGCVPEVARARAIAAEGTSADRQVAAYAAARAAGSDHSAGLVAAVDWIAGAVI